MYNAIQFIGTQRSGSNLLRVMLNQHPQIAAPHPPHILQVMMPLLRMYGNLESDAAFRQLVDDTCTLVERNPVNWGVKFDRENIYETIESRSLPQVMKSIYEAKAQSKQATHWCCKSMASIHYIREIEEAGLHPFYIFIYRDGRDVACSFRKAVVGEKHMYNLAQQWKTEQELSIALCERVGETHSILIRYEDLILDPKRELERICSALNIPFVENMLDYTTAEESQVTASSGKMWGNLVKPVMKENTRKFLKELAYDDLVIFESVAGDTLKKLGYPLEIPFEKRKTFSAEEIAAFNELNTRWQQEMKALSTEDMNKRKAQDDFIAELKNRFRSFTLNNEVHA
ncbi:MAG TPA: sulfotransferase [Bacteroidia bacterium]|nr:sulfotransferase [Bacteroidia bacterium]